MRPPAVGLGPERPSTELYDDATSVAVEYPPVRLPTQPDADTDRAADDWARVCEQLTTASEWT